MALYCVQNLTRSCILVSALCLFSVRSDQSAGTGADQPRTQPLTSRTVRTKYGDVSGVIVTLDSKHLEPVEVFRGIPYASPPLGSLRFMPPVTGALWSGVKIADKFSPVCPQRLPDIFNETAALKRMPKGRLEYLKRLLPYLRNQSEDCLYLNIYAPAQVITAICCYTKTKITTGTERILKAAKNCGLAQENVTGILSSSTLPENTRVENESTPQVRKPELLPNTILSPQYSLGLSDEESDHQNDNDQETSSSCCTMNSEDKNVPTSGISTWGPCGNVWNQ
ncbi:neuroligin [Holotrichia oblita]|uniref:Neuroligin n=1 Tax=Holotrichia oblita TaxID=644536 RepID=A0ACB9TGW0_HOLOL|nr:neuroligin [Holotrichia oblita]